MFEIPFFRTGFNYDRSAASDESGIECTDRSLAQRQFREDSDINTIVRRFNLTGQLPQGVQVPQYVDFGSVSDYHTALNMVMSADSAFMALPADVRARFENDPGQLVDFVSDSKNYEEAVKLGLALPKRNLEPLAQPVAEEARPEAAAVVDNVTV